MWNFHCILLACIIFAPCAWGQPQVTLRRVFSDLVFQRPVDMQHWGESLFVVEQQGRIWMLENRSNVTERNPFLDIQDRVRSVSNEEGLLGLAFHPDYGTNGYFFVYYTASSPRRTVVSRFRRVSDVLSRGDPSSEVIVLEVNQPAGNHNGGQIAFGPDGYLYIALGDGGGANDQFNNGQNRQSLLGTISRIDVRDLPYSIPPDNPFVNSSGDRPEIFAWGLRNPWRFSFDSQTGVLYAADVGQNAIEEVNIIENGGNYGWPIMEGTHCFRPRTNCDQTGLISPIFEYDHANGPAAVTGGYVFYGPGVPSLRGWYIFGDYVDGRFWGLRHDGDRLLESRLLTDTFLSPLSFGIDHQEEVYMLASDGHIYRFAATAGPLGFESRIPPVKFILNRENPELVLPAAWGGSGEFSYMLSPELPAGLSFHSPTRTVQGTAEELLPATTYTLHAEDTGGLRGSIEFEISVQAHLHQENLGEVFPGFFLHGSYPNPSSGDTRIIFDLSRSSSVMVELHDITGRRIKTIPFRTMTASVRQSILIPTGALPGGPYLYRMTVEAEKKAFTTSGILVVQ